MAKYVMNKNAQSDDDHEVHKEGCYFFPSPENQKPLGDFEHCFDAVQEALKINPNADGCKFCSPSCHNS